MTDDSEILARLKSGDESAFRHLVREHHGSLVAIIRTLVRNDATADEVVQESWLGVVRGIQTFEERSSLKTWIFAIALNTAKKRLRKDGRIDLLESLSSPARDAEAPLDDRFDHRGHWAKPPLAWSIDPETQAERAQLVEMVKMGIETLPEAQRTVIRLRDIEEFSGPETCVMLDISEANQRVLLHRARTSVRLFVEEKLKTKGS